MSRRIPLSVQIARASEALRQETATFNQRYDHAERWFSLRLVMCYVAIILLPSFFLLSAYILVNAQSFGATVVNAAAAALFADGLAFLMAVWRLVLNPPSPPSARRSRRIARRSIRTDTAMSST